MVEGTDHECSNNKDDEDDDYKKTIAVRSSSRVTLYPNDLAHEVQDQRQSSTRLALAIDE